MSVSLGLPTTSRPASPRGASDRAQPTTDSIDNERVVSAATDRPSNAVAPGLIDRFGRAATDLRVSLTDQCNLRCTYCMPAEGLPFLGRNKLLTADEIVRLVGIAVRELGVQQVRFTGGEPLLRKDLADIVAGCAALEPRPELSLTTNAIGLANRAEGLAAAGLDRVNVSLDSVVASTFERMTRRPLFDRVIEGIEAAAAAGLTPIKINAVLLRGQNDLEAPGLLAWCLERGYELRVIEQMPLDSSHVWDRGDMVTAAETRALLETRFALRPDTAPRDGAPAERFVVHARQADGSAGERLGTVGIIASVSEPFCGDCRRTRVTAEGRVRSCLFSHTETDLRAALREASEPGVDPDPDGVEGVAASDAHVADLWRAAMWAKASGHGMNEATFTQPDRPMSAIGG